MSLNSAQKLLIEKTAISSIYSDIVENRNGPRLARLVGNWVHNLSVEDQLSQISSDEDVVREELGFDPVTGEKIESEDKDEFKDF